MTKIINILHCITHEEITQMVKVICVEEISQLHEPWDDRLCFWKIIEFCGQVKVLPRLVMKLIAARSPVVVNIGKLRVAFTEYKRVIREISLPLKQVRFMGHSFGKDIDKSSNLQSITQAQMKDQLT